jgi:hypothetical protein
MEISRKLIMKKAVVLFVMLLTLCLLSTKGAEAQWQWGQPKTVMLTIDRPPQFELTVKRVAFGQSSGNCANVATELIDRMLLPDFQRNGMEVIERQALNQIISEHDFDQSIYVNANQSTQLGKILGPSELIFVSVNTCYPEQLPQYSDQYNYATKSSVRTYISKTRYSLEGSVRVVNLTTGQIVGSHDYESKPQEINQSLDGQPEFPHVDEVKDKALQDVGAQIHAMFFASGYPVALTFYDDKECNLKDIYQTYKNGDQGGALRMADAEIQQCPTEKHKDKTLVRAYYDDGLLHCLQGDFDRSKVLFTSAMDGKGADAVVDASAACEKAQAGMKDLRDYQARWAQIQTPAPINNQPAIPVQTKADSGVIPQAQSNSISSQTKARDQAPNGSAETVEKRLKTLDDLYRRGLINKKDYDAKKAEILSDL